MFLNIDELTWDDAATPLLDHSIDTFRPLLTRIDKNDVDRVVEATKAEAHPGNRARYLRSHRAPAFSGCGGPRR